MIAEETLARAVSEGIITQTQADSLRALQGAAPTPPPLNAWSEPAPKSPDDESLRFISGFGDIFVVIGLALFFGATGFFLQHFFTTPVMWAGLAALAWVLAEFFTRQRRMALPSIVLLAIFAGSIFAAVTHAVAGWDPFAWFTLGEAARDLVFKSIWLAGLTTAAAAGLHYWRFRVPITIAAAAAALAATVIGFFVTLWPNPEHWALNVMILLCGLAIFALAMRFDAADPQRLTRRTDIAFWLHLLAAPLIVHPVISSLLGDGAQLETAGALAILAIFLLFALVAVAIDRRAMLVSGLTYAGIAFGTLLRQTGFSDFTVPATLLALGAFVLLLSAGWQPLRRVILKLFPASILRRLPRPVHKPS